MAWPLFESGGGGETQPNLLCWLAEGELRPGGARHIVGFLDDKLTAAQVTRPSRIAEPFAGTLKQGGGTVSKGRQAQPGQVAIFAVEGDEGKRPWCGVVVQPVGLLPVGLAGDIEEEAMEATGVDVTAVQRFV